ncbi:MAG: SLC13 family permease [Acetobacterales bacterium]
MKGEWLTAATFVAVYCGMALGRWPGLAIDRTGVAVVGAILLFVVGATDGPRALGAIDFPTLTILFGLMVLSAQVAASGFFDWCGAALVRTGAGPVALLCLVVGLSGALSAMLTNDVVVWAMTPVLVQALLRRGLDPRPFVIALAGAANAGSAATIIGNPQNLLIGEVGELAFWPFVVACGVPALLSLAAVAGVTAVVWRGRFVQGVAVVGRQEEAVPLDRAALFKACAGVAAVLLAFTLSDARAVWVLAVAGLLLVSRRLGTRRMLGMVDWHLLLLFAALFVVTAAMADTGLPALALETARELGFDPQGAGLLAIVSLAGSNTIGNVPLVTMLLSLGIPFDTHALYALALFSTLSGNLLIVGSIANIIAVERAAAEGIHIGFTDYARIGVPVTLISLAVAWGWLELIVR